MRRKPTFWKWVERADVAGWLAILLAVVWILAVNFGIPPLPVESERVFPQLSLAILGWLLIYQYRALEEIRRYTAETSSETIIGNDAIYHAATRLVKNSPPRGRLWATSLWLHATLGEEAPMFGRYFHAILDRLRNDPETQYLRAIRATNPKGWERLRKRTEELLALPHSNAGVRFYHDNPLAMDCLIGEQEALIGFPDRATYPHLGVAILIRDPEAVESLRQWYLDFIWNGPVANTPIRTKEDLEEIEKTLMEKSTGLLPASHPSSAAPR
jgi:hypothetical protein